MPAIRENTLYIFKYKEMEYKKTYYTITYITNFIMREKFLQQTFIRNSSFFYVCNFYGLLLNQFGGHTLIFKGNPFTWLFSKLHFKKGGRINNKVPLYSTGNCIQYPIINKWRNFPRGPVAKTLHFQCRGRGSIPGKGTRFHIPQLNFTYLN